MRMLLAGVMALVVGLAGCTTPSQKAEEEDYRYRLLLGSAPAMYCLASARDYESYAEELEREVREQKRLVRELKMRAQEVFGEAGRVRRNTFLPKNVREAEALNLEGEGRRMREEVANRDKLVGVLENRAAWYRRRAHRESQRISQIMHNDIPSR